VWTQSVQENLNLNCFNLMRNCANFQIFDVHILVSIFAVKYSRAQANTSSHILNCLYIWSVVHMFFLDVIIVCSVWASLNILIINVLRYIQFAVIAIKASKVIDRMSIITIIALSNVKDAFYAKIDLLLKPNGKIDILKLQKI